VIVLEEAGPAGLLFATGVFVGALLVTLLDLSGRAWGLAGKAAGALPRPSRVVRGYVLIALGATGLVAFHHLGGAWRIGLPAAAVTCLAGVPPLVRAADRIR
jgi:hypothetical protein